MKHKQQLKIPCPSESGFTIIESLIAMLVVTVLLTAIAPVIVLATASRVQARRIELGTLAARSYIDGVRTGAIPIPAATGTNIELKDFPTPTAGSLTCNANAYCTAPATPATTLYCIDGNGDAICNFTNSKDLVIQAFRYNKASTDASVGYQLGIRVYRADGFNSGGDLVAGRKQATFTAGIGDRKAPLVEMTTVIPPQSTSFNEWCNRLKVTDSTTSNTTCN
ncbi:type II secretion system protein [Calothrix sp. FACHB-1219]|uniref:hormogonium polysaccharide secretion pseudopilin HpsB n=1 Tax=unclassified Calothrix TaxID=2619626 RepID=UPI0016898F4D|nr:MULTISPECIES: hormogonium polysaccharide secretion pseudopilin HpsB [unclassified Calothrix]MBD2204056.1 type II secretion system protein [Calothrix sp. FACHB-168]MBD2221229.1 type II secretion system protein [Calothrix sp. FACHB-1219]